jgi:hypothetical protein
MYWGTVWKWVVSFTPWPHYPGVTAPGTPWIGGWVGPKASLDVVAKSEYSINDISKRIKM